MACDDISLPYGRIFLPSLFLPREFFICYFSLYVKICETYEQLGTLELWKIGVINGGVSQRVIVTATFYKFWFHFGIRMSCNNVCRSLTYSIQLRALSLDLILCRDPSLLRFIREWVSTEFERVLTILRLLIEFYTVLTLFNLVLVSLKTAQKNLNKSEKNQLRNLKKV